MCSLTQRSGPTIRSFVHKTARSNINNDPSHKRDDDCHCDHHRNFLHHNFLHVHFLHDTTLEHDNIENCDLDYLYRRGSPGLLCQVRASTRSCWRTGRDYSLRLGSCEGDKANQWDVLLLEVFDFLRLVVRPTEEEVLDKLGGWSSSEQKGNGTGVVLDNNRS